MWSLPRSDLPVEKYKISWSLYLNASGEARAGNSSLFKETATVSAVGICRSKGRLKNTVIFGYSQCDITRSKDCNRTVFTIFKFTRSACTARGGWSRPPVASWWTLRWTPEVSASKLVWITCWWMMLRKYFDSTFWSWKFRTFLFFQLSTSHKIWRQRIKDKLQVCSTQNWSHCETHMAGPEPEWTLSVTLMSWHSGVPGQTDERQLARCCGEGKLILFLQADNKETNKKSKLTLCWFLKDSLHK